VTDRTIAICGLGLIGGSLGLALRDLGSHLVLGFDSDPETARSARDRGAVEVLLPEATALPPDADLVVCAIPPRAAAALVPTLVDAAPGGAAVTDLSSVMLPVLTAVLEEPSRAGRFVGSHPLAGSERGGIASARGDLFRDAPVLLGAPPDPGSAAARVAALWTSVGARPTVLAPALHDALVALTSHVPQVTSTALVRTLRRTGTLTGTLARGAGPGLRDMARLAGSPPDLWYDILTLNADKVVPALELLEREVRGLRHAIERKDPTLRSLLEEARAFQREIVR